MMLPLFPVTLLQNLRILMQHAGVAGYYCTLTLSKISVSLFFALLEDQDDMASGTVIATDAKLSALSCCGRQQQKTRSKGCLPDKSATS